MNDKLEDIRLAHERLDIWYKARVGASSNTLPLGLTNWTYDGDQHVPAIEKRDVIFMGFNAGGGEGSVVPKVGRSERNWRTRCSRLSNKAAHEIVFTELISVPTHNQALLQLNEASAREMMRASAELNQAIIAYHSPSIVYQTGLTQWHLDAVEDIYGLKKRNSRFRLNHPGHRLLVHYDLPDGTPWIAIKHFASPGFSKEDRGEIQVYVSQL